MSTASVSKPVARKSVAVKKTAVAKAPVAVKRPAAAKKAVVAVKPAAARKVKAVAVPLKTVIKPVKPKLVRDSFTMLADEHRLITDLKQTFKKAGVSVKKSELVRVCLTFLKDADVPTLQAMLRQLPVLKPSARKS